MEFLGIGPLELFFILIIALIVLGPHDMVKAGRTIGKFLRKVVTSPTWYTVQQTSRELRSLPNKLIREAGIEELKNDLREVEKIGQEAGLNKIKDEFSQWRDEISEWTTPPITIDTPSSPPEATQNPGEGIGDQDISETSSGQDQESGLS